MLDAAAPHARWIDAFCERGAFDEDQARTILQAGAARGLAGRLHANQLGPGPGVRLACELGLAAVDHCTHLDNADMAALADSGTVATLLPGVEFSTRSPYPDARALLDAGVVVALASDCNPGSRGRAHHRHSPAARGRVENIAGYRQQLTELEAETEDVVGAVTYDNFQQVQHRFYDLVLRADVGRIDVAWARREEHRMRVEMLTRDRAREMRMLDDEFRENHGRNRSRGRGARRGGPAVTDFIPQPRPRRHTTPPRRSREGAGARDRARLGPPSPR